VRPIDEHLVTDYLLGAASESETERLDEMSVTDGEFVTRLKLAEDELVDAYTRSELSGDVLTRFRSHYLASPLRQEKVRVAESFKDFAHQQVSAPPVVAEASKASQRRVFVFPRFALQWGFAALALLFVVGAGYLVFQNRQLRNEMTRAEAERLNLEKREQELKRELEGQQSADTAKQQELNEVRERLAQLAQQQPGNESREPVTVAFNLSPQTRGTTQPPTINVPNGADSLLLTLDLEATGFPSYEVRLKDPGTGQTVWRSGKLKAVKNGTALRLNLPANVLKTQNYVIQLSSFSPDGKSEDAGSYSFRIHRS
jgi:hypothetical protein